MKLYTEEQVLEIIANINRDVSVSSQELLKGIEVDHIELPSDEEIKKMCKAYIEHVNTMVHKDLERDGYLNVGFHVGAKSMRNKIQGGEQ
jgi:hypothetical protein